MRVVWPPHSRPLARSHRSSLPGPRLLLAMLSSYAAEPLRPVRPSRLVEIATAAEGCAEAAGSCASSTPDRRG